MFSSSKSLKIFVFIILIIASSLNVFAAAGDVDPTFRPVPSRVSESLSGSKILVQPDGKNLIYGNFKVINGVPVNGVARLNTDGSLDQSFNCSDCGLFASVDSVVIQPDGKIIIAGSKRSDDLRPELIRVNSDGSRDNSFFAPVAAASNAYPNFSASVYNIQPDGKIFVGINVSAPVQFGATLYRLNTDGSTDATFKSFYINMRRNLFLGGLLPLPDGKFFLYGATEFGYLARFNRDGTKDETFESPTLTREGGFNSTPSISRIAFQSNGKLIVGGAFDTINGTNYKNFARLNSDGSVDLTFTNLNEIISGPLAVLSNDKILVQSRFDIALGGLYKLIRLNADGTKDNTFNAPDNLDFVTNLKVTPANQLIGIGSFLENSSLVKRIVRLNSDGTLDAAFNVNVGINGIIRKVAVQPDGKILLIGEFDRVNDIPRNTIARVNADGTLDASFDSGGSFNTPPEDAVVAADGKIIVVGYFTTFQRDIGVNYIARLQPDGGILDTSFLPVLDAQAQVVSLQPDGKVLIGGRFTTVNGTNQAGIARLNTDGSLDASFKPLLGNPQISTILVQPDGKILVGGTFSGANGFNRINLVRLNADGSLDNSFNAGNLYGVSKVILNAEGGYYVLAGTVNKLNSDGTAVSNFKSPAFDGASLRDITLTPDGGFIVGGRISQVNNFPQVGNIARFTSNSEFLSLSFEKGANGEIYDLEKQADGKLLIGGDFSSFENIPRSGIVRITIPAVKFKTLFDYDGDGKADVSVFRPSTNIWYSLRSGNLQVSQQNFGISGDIAAPADYDGDGITDLGIFRPSTGDWWYLSSVDNVQKSVHLGGSGDIPRPSDFDGDNKADFIVYRPSNNVWYRLGSKSLSYSNVTFGTAGDKPLIGDFDGDGKSDPAIYRFSTGQWWYLSSVDFTQRAASFGISTDIPVAADYDGDGKTDFAVYRPSNGVWYILNSSNGRPTIIQFGISEDKPAAADYDGDGKADIAVYRPSTGTWYLLQTTKGFAALQFGISSDVPTPNAFVP